MGMPRSLPVVLGSVALLSTSAVLVIHVILVGHLPDPGTARTTAIISAVLEAVALIALSWIFAAYFIVSNTSRSKRSRGMAFGASVLVCFLATVSSVATMISLSNSARTSAQSLMGANQMAFMIGSSIALGLSFACQLLFIVVHFVLARMISHGLAHSLYTEDDSAHSPQMTIKSVPYSLTMPSSNRTRGSTSMDSRSPPSSSGGKSSADAISSFRTSFNSVVRPLASKTRLLPGDKRNGESLDAGLYRQRNSTHEDGFDSWDTSSVDPHNRQTVLQTSSPPPSRFLETIPASPTTSRSPSPGFPLDLEPPRSRRRSRSYSPVAVGGRRPRAATTSEATTAESHIHPLFRSDSPAPPAIATPGTMVIAAPNGGQMMSDCQSIRTLSRMRSGSLPTTPSPLTPHEPFDDLAHPRPKSRKASPTNPNALGIDTAAPGERKMTPPIPDWILSAGARTSLTGYQSRKIRIEPGSNAI